MSAHVDFLANVYLDLLHEDATPCNTDRGWYGTTKASGGNGCKRRKGRSATARRARQKQAAKLAAKKEANRTNEFYKYTREFTPGSHQAKNTADLNRVLKGLGPRDKTLANRKRMNRVKRNAGKYNVPRAATPGSPKARQMARKTKTTSSKSLSQQLKESGKKASAAESALDRKLTENEAALSTAQLAARKMGVGINEARKMLETAGIKPKKRRKKKSKKLSGRNTISSTAPLRNRQAAEDDD